MISLQGSLFLPVTVIGAHRELARLKMSAIDLRMTQATGKQRTRMDPALRRSHILNCAAEIITEQGVTGLNMDALAKRASISKSLIYNYFSNTNELMSELLERELRQLRKLQNEAAENARTFEGLVRAITHVYLTYINERGLIIERLQHEPSISDGHDPTDYSRDAAVEYVASIIERHFELPSDLAKAVTDISFGLPATAGSFLLHNNMSLQQVENLAVTMILGSIDAVKASYSNTQKPLRD
ncbi:TetR/AcrR family transcriptional regulator [Altererythrobacter sp. MF3-039]|uniref:TetR/AcrR family transcriptional regulator n=1 Tax=Altererythrobacter sp. MF3-039 TaxID=3252901 RepID=UPI00390C676F